MWRVLRIALIIVIAYAAITASPAQKMAMYDGARALAASVRDACMRAKPCHDAIQLAARSVVSLRPEQYLTTELPRRERSLPLLER